MINPTALISGASNGIGLELAYEHANCGGNLILVARNTKKLEEIKLEIETKFKVKVNIISKDLSLKDAAQDIYNEVKKHNLQVDYLINNAGFGDFGMFVSTDWNKEEEMINLNITALSQFTKLFIKDMVARKNGKILNLASTASFQPGPTMAVYFATKAYVLSFSEAVANEVKEFGVTVTALCPGPTESGFQTAASMDNAKLFKDKKLPSSSEVAKYGYDAMLKGKTVAIHGTLNYILANSIRLLPRNLVTKIIRSVQE
ncbi:SDR family NAD(P)-dependent oxidoreductase [Flavobacterium sp.]|uniref:SDR family NAD(P)-dependent oxidoreductase n=1 Tax=Flavobacterium sp. TaxID=239 RepID=UPI00375220D0